MDRTCGMCGEAKPLTSEFFSWKRKSSGKFQHHCRECQRSYRREHYLQNKQKYIEKAGRWRKVGSEKAHQWLVGYLTTHPCVDCGESDVIVLEFDHLDPELKRTEVSLMVNGGWSLDTIQKEIDKCEVVCCNCHRRRTATRAGWRRLAIVGQPVVRHSSKVK